MSKFAEVGKYNSDLVILAGDERIVVENWFADGNSRMAAIRFADGTVWDSERVNSRISLVYGSDGSDILHGIDGADNTIIGGRGEDHLRGGAGNDVYVWNRGDGNDTISDGGGDNILQFGEGITQEEVSIMATSGADLLIRVGNEQIVVKDWIERPENRLKEIRFADGTAWSGEDIHAQAVTVNGTDGDDVLNRKVGVGNIFIGGKGDDLIIGSTREDTYIWNIGDGSDVIITNDTGRDVLVMGEGVAPSSVRFDSDNRDLYLLVGEERVTITDWFYRTTHQLKEIRFADGTVMGRDMISATVHNTIGTDADETIYGADSEADVMIGKGGDDLLIGGDGYDRYIWNLGDGNDRIIDSEGWNTLEFGEGIEPSSVKISREGYDLKLAVAEESVTIQDWFKGRAYQRFAVEFAGGVYWSSEEITERGRSIYGTAADETLSGFDNTDDILTGLGGDDILSGNGGNDVYVWNIGDGNDRIIDSSGKNVLRLGAGISADSVTVRRDESHLYFIIGEERIAVTNWFSDATQTGFQTRRARADWTESSSPTERFGIKIRSIISLVSFRARMAMTS